ncbi:HU family DNA-binding protein [Sphingomonas aerophila]|uniref:Integration host factor subunit alpha n=1 Tax=Sphingomonas aerophila TaxID=1344948 RepID=A0A7W9EWD2_9SPHN|nr:HU family DNA-binding protein [Sphingomonas aerophila]MBB5715418.1 integration host factor subunit alpha [Sphingomonas aerophila]
MTLGTSSPHLARENMTREDLARGLARAHGLLLDQAKGLVDNILDQIGAALERGENVSIANFGVFEIREKPARIGRNPATMQPFPIAARKILTFRIDKNARERIYEAARPAA